MLDKALMWLSERLPDGWEVERGVGLVVDNDQSARSNGAAISISAPNGPATPIAIEVKGSISPRSVLNLISPLAQTARILGGDVPLLVIAPWISGRTQDLLSEQRINFVDLTGNSRIQLDDPALFIQTIGSSRNPKPAERGPAQLKGAKAARLIRLLADVSPPYGVNEISEASELTAGYVSRLLDTLYREALIERSPRGPVESVDVPNLIRRWATSYDVFKTNASTRFVAPAGTDQILSRIAGNPNSETRIAITGSFAASRLAPVASPTLLLAFTDSPTSTAQNLDLLPADEGANVVLLKPFNSIVWSRTTVRNGLTYVAPSQVAVDCLSGDGRMPAEGEALIEWMSSNEAMWRAESIVEAEVRQDD